MALSGVHIAFGGFRKVAKATLPISAEFSETMATSAVSSPDPFVNIPPNAILLSISASAAIFYITGKNLTLAMLTDGVTPSRYYDPTLGGGREDIMVFGGDQFAWAFA
jgi:hypothetical protein